MQDFFFLFHMELMLLAGISRLQQKSILCKGSITTITKITRASAFLPPRTGDLFIAIARNMPGSHPHRAQSVRAVSRCYRTSAPGA